MLGSVELNEQDVALKVFCALLANPEKAREYQELKVSCDMTDEQMHAAIIGDAYNLASEFINFVPPSDLHFQYR